VEGDTLITPPLAEGPVQGTMRRHLLEQAPAKGFRVKEDLVSTERLLAADEVFLTNAIYGLKWVKQVGEKTLPCKLSGAVHQAVVATLWL
jgi:branched-chain amino acid aminotransferase